MGCKPWSCKESDTTEQRNNKTTASAGGCSTLGRRGRSANVRVGVGVRSLPPSFIQKFEDFKGKRVLFMED